MACLTRQPSESRVVVVGAGTMGTDVALVLGRGGCAVTVCDQDAGKGRRVAAEVRGRLVAAGHTAARVDPAISLSDIGWDDVALVVENVTESLALKQALFAELDALASPDTVLASNSSGLPIGEIGGGAAGAARMLGLHFFMPADLIPLVEVVMGPRSDAEAAGRLCDFMRGCGSVPVLVRKDKPGFLANRLQHALTREAFALVDEGVASLHDVDAAVRFGFGLRFLAAGPALQRDHGGLDVHCAAAAHIYPSLNNSAEPARVLREHVQAGRLGMKTGAGFFDWPDGRRQAEQARYESLLRKALELLVPEGPFADRPAPPCLATGGAP